MVRTSAHFALLALLLPCTPALAESSEDLLSSLSGNLLVLKQSVSGQFKSPSGLPSVAPLVGTTRQQVLLALGQPDNCAGLTDGQCSTLSEWRYEFYRLPKGSRGGGPELQLRFTDQTSVEEAEWQFYR